MRHAIVTMADIAKCPTHNLSPSHWIGGHHTEECTAHKEADAIREDEQRALNADIEAARKRRDKRTAERIEELRRNTQ